MWYLIHVLSVAAAALAFLQAIFLSSVLETLTTNGPQGAVDLIRAEMGKGGGGQLQDVTGTKEWQVGGPGTVRGYTRRLQSPHYLNYFAISLAVPTERDAKGPREDALDFRAGYGRTLIHWQYLGHILAVCQPGLMKALLHDSPLSPHTLQAVRQRLEEIARYPHPKMRRLEVRGAGFVLPAAWWAS